MKSSDLITKVAVPIITAIIGGVLGCGVTITIINDGNTGEVTTEVARESTSERKVEKTSTTTEKPPTTTTTEAEPQKQPEPIDICSLHTLISSQNSFFDSGADEEDNMGNSYQYKIFCYDSYKNDITYALDGKYSKLSATFGLRDIDGDNKNTIWIEFYSMDRDKIIKKLGETERFKAGVRPTDVEISLTGVKDLKMITRGESDNGFLLTDGIFIE